jgi:hypothetical protein
MTPRPGLPAPGRLPRAGRDQVFAPVLGPDPGGEIVASGWTRTLAFAAGRIIVRRLGEASGFQGGNMNQSNFAGAVAASLLLLAAPAVAQESAAPAEAAPAPEAAPAVARDSAAPPAAPQAAPPCELHVFPSENFMVQKTGWLAGFGVVGAVADAALNADAKLTIDELMRQYLDGQGQVDAIAGLDLADLLGKPVRVIAEAPLSRPQVKALKATHGRLSSSSAACYSELVVGKIFYQKAAMWGAHITTKFHYRDFGSGVPRTLSGKGKKSIDGFPPKNPAGVADAQAALRDAFARMFDEYARNTIDSVPPQR